MKGIGRNDPCPCGSGKKFKRCCLLAAAPEGAWTRAERESAQVALPYDEDLGLDLAQAVDDGASLGCLSAFGSDWPSWDRAVTSTKTAMNTGT